jgi:hypothetical protein
MKTSIPGIQEFIAETKTVNYKEDGYEHDKEEDMGCIKSAVKHILIVIYLNKIKVIL